MGAAHDRWHLLILCLLGSVINVRSERPQSQNADGDDLLESPTSERDTRQRKLEGSLIEVGAHHLKLATASLQKLPESHLLQRGDAVEVLETFEGDNEKGTRQTLQKGLIGTVRDIDGDGDASIDFFPQGAKDEVFHQWVFKLNVQKLGKADKKAAKPEALATASAIQLSPPDEDFDDFEAELSSTPTATRRTFNLDGETKPEAFQVPSHDAQHRSGGLDPDTFSTGDDKLDRLGETDTPGMFPSHAAPQDPHPLISLDPEHDSNGANALFVPDQPEKSHVETDMLGGDEGNQRYSHFQELLNLKPAVLGAIDIYRNDLKKHRVKANGVAKKTESAVEKVQVLNDGVKQIHEAATGASKESEKETRKMAIDTLEDFGMFNKHGVFGKDKKGEWSKDAGKWSIFKTITSKAKDLKVADMKWDNFRSFLGPDNDIFPPAGEGGATTHMQHNLQEDDEIKAQPVLEGKEQANALTEHANPVPLIDLPDVDAHGGGGQQAPAPSMTPAHTEQGNPHPLVPLPAHKM